VGDFGIKNIFISFLKILFSSIVMGCVAYYFLPYIKNIFGDSFIGVLVVFCVVCLLSFLVYGILTVLMKMPEVKSVKRIILKNED
jgi:peptidoglycan biosynthesis protein MviN/MurJ (putative lipid II flippase)